MSQYRVYFAVGAVVIGLGILSPFFLGGSAANPKKQQEIVFVDRESGEAFLCPADRLNPIHPRTGQQSLGPAAYCEKCQAWKLVGRTDRAQDRRSALLCPIHKTLMSREGPLPETRIE